MLSTIYDNFKLPIEYVEKTKPILDNLDKDLELTKANEGSEISVYKKILNPQTTFGELCIEPFSKYYTTDVTYLKETQDLCKNINDVVVDKNVIENTWENYKNIKNNKSFLDTYQYIDWSYFKWMNKMGSFLLILGFYNLSSPVINLFAPVFMLIVPFFILKVMGLPVTTASYYNILVQQLKRHAIGQLFTKWNSVTFSKKMYLLFCFGMYLYSIYQNILSCRRFYKNTNYIASTFKNFKTYIDYSVENITYYVNLISEYKKYDEFKNVLLDKKEKLVSYYNKFVGLPTEIVSFKTLPYLGESMKYFYTIYDSSDFKETIEYSFAFNGYLDVMKNISNNVKNKTINKIKLLEDKKTKLVLKQHHHPLIEDKPVKNDLNLKKNKVITGPNASGKTTLLKSTIINILLTQQVGYGYYKSGKITPFHHIHCYMNIPDTNGRDSLFQAEARRCLEILNNMEENKNDRHFAIFDELYSGTNPYEAISSAHAYLKYISKNKKIKFMLTTHFIKLCDLLDDDKKYIENCNMKTTVDDNDIPTYEYKIKKGISKIKGGICVLKDLKYPRKIIANTKKILRTI